MRRQPSTRPAALLAAHVRAERRAAREAALARRRDRQTLYNRFTRRWVLNTTRNKKNIAARAIQNWFGSEFELTVLVYRPLKASDGPGRQRNERGDVLMSQPREARVSLGELRALRRGDMDALERHFNRANWFESEPPSSYDIKSVRKMHSTAQPLDMTTSLAMGAPTWVDDPYIKFSACATSEYANLWVRRRQIKNACWFSIIIDVYRGPFNAYLCLHRASEAFPRDLDYEIVWGICFPGRPFDVVALQAGMNFHDVVPFFKAYGLGLREVNALRETLNELAPERHWGGGIPSGIIVLKTDKHVRRLNVTDKDKDATGRSLR